MKTSLILLMLLSIEGMASTIETTTPLTTDNITNEQFINKIEKVRILRENRVLTLIEDRHSRYTRAGREIRKARDSRHGGTMRLPRFSRDNRNILRLARTNRLNRFMHVVKVAKLEEPIQIAGLH